MTHEAVLSWWPLSSFREVRSLKRIIYERGDVILPSRNGSDINARTFSPTETDRDRSQASRRLWRPGHLHNSLRPGAVRRRRDKPQDGRGPGHPSTAPLQRGIGSSRRTRGAQRREPPRQTRRRDEPGPRAQTRYGTGAPEATSARTTTSGRSRRLTGAWWHRPWPSWCETSRATWTSPGLALKLRGHIVRTRWVFTCHFASGENLPTARAIAGKAARWPPRASSHMTEVSIRRHALAQVRSAEGRHRSRGHERGYPSKVRRGRLSIWPQGCVMIFPSRDGRTSDGGAHAKPVPR